MPDETEIRPGGEDHAGDAHGERAGQQSPLQGRAAFIKNWDWQLVASLNRGSCHRGKALHGNNSKTHERVRQRWDERRPRELTLGETLDFLLECHRSAPFLFFNGNTFGEIARRVSDAIFIEFPLGRRREAASLLCLDSKTGGRTSAFCINHSTFVLGFALTPKPGGKLVFNR